MYVLHIFSALFLYYIHKQMLSFQILNYIFFYITCKGISFPNEKIIYPLLTFKRRNDMEQKVRSSRSFCRTTKKYARKDVLQKAKLFTL